MPSTLDLCEKYYGTRDIYDLMGITKDALEKDGTKSKVTIVLVDCWIEKIALFYS